MYICSIDVSKRSKKHNGLEKVVLKGTCIIQRRTNGNNWLLAKEFEKKENTISKSSVETSQCKRCYLGVRIWSSLEVFLLILRNLQILRSTFFNGVGLWDPIPCN